MDDGVHCAGFRIFKRGQHPYLEITIYYVVCHIESFQQNYQAPPCT